MLMKRAIVFSYSFPIHPVKMNVYGYPFAFLFCFAKRSRIETGEMARSRTVFVSFESGRKANISNIVGIKGVGSNAKRKIERMRPKSKRNLALRRETVSGRRIRVAMAGAKTPCVAMMFAVTRGAAALRRRARRTARTRIKQVQHRIVRRPSLPLSLPLDYAGRCSIASE